MGMPFGYSHVMPPESESRQLDARVKEQEMCYGYTTPPPPADTHDYDQAAKETSMSYYIKPRD